MNLRTLLILATLAPGLHFQWIVACSPLIRYKKIDISVPKPEEDCAFALISENALAKTLATTRIAPEAFALKEKNYRQLPKPFVKFDA